MMELADWPKLAAIVALAGTLAGFIVWLLRARLQGDFASRGDVTALGERMDAIEARLATVPTHHDVQQINHRLSVVESGVAGLGARVDGVREGVSRVERDLGLLLQHELGKAGQKQ
jgi:hypothetical protein